MRFGRSVTRGTAYLAEPGQRVTIAATHTATSILEDASRGGATCGAIKKSNDCSALEQNKSYVSQ
jgi:hypothetical protein